MCDDPASETMIEPPQADPAGSAGACPDRRGIGATSCLTVHPFRAIETGRVKGGGAPTVIFGSRNPNVDHDLATRNFARRGAMASTEGARPVPSGWFTDA